MSELPIIFRALRRELKAQGKTYAQLAHALQLSEASVKRLFADENVTLERLEQICRFLELTLGELIQSAADAPRQISMLTPEQERALIQDDKLMLVAVCAMNHWRLEDIVQFYALSEAEALAKLLALDKMGFLRLLPNNRIRLNLERDFAWQPNGPIQQYWLSLGLKDYFDSPFTDKDSFALGHAMLTRDEIHAIQTEMQRLMRKLALSHEKCAALERAETRGVALLCLFKHWEPEAFRRLRR